MNPVLLKPGSDRRSHVVRDGAAGRRGLRRATSSTGGGISRGRRTRRSTTCPSRYDVVVAEGAGSPAEINLRASDYVNMGLARHAGPADRGGRRHRPRRGVRGDVRHRRAARRRRTSALVAGFVVNKFRGDVDLLRPGLDELERAAPAGRCTACCPGTRTSGSTPRTRSTSTAGAPRRTRRREGRRRAAAADQQLHRRRRARARARTSTSSSPPTRATSPTPTWSCCPAPARRSPTWPGCASAASTGRSSRTPRAGRPVLGICGGFQMLGRTIADPRRRRGTAGAAVDGLGLLDVTHRRSAPRRCCAGRTERRRGYEIHHGRITVGDGEFLGGAGRARLRHDVARQPGGRRAARAAFLARGARASTVDRRRFPAARERRLDLLGDLVEEHLDVDALLDLAATVRRGLPLLPPGSAMRVLLLGGTAEARELAAVLVDDGRRRDLVAGRPGRAAAAAGRRGADRRLRRRRRACGAALRELRRRSSTRPTRSPRRCPPTPPRPAPPRASRCCGSSDPGWSALRRRRGTGSTPTTQAAGRGRDAGRAAVPHRRPAGAGRLRRRRWATRRCWRASSTRPTIDAAGGVDGCCSAAGPTRSTDELALMREHARRRAGHQGLRRRPTPGRRWRPPPSSASRSSSYAGRRRPTGVRDGQRRRRRRRLGRSAMSRHRRPAAAPTRSASRRAREMSC